MVKRKVMKRLRGKKGKWNPIKKMNGVYNKATEKLERW